jgi:hypothetical protein
MKKLIFLLLLSPALYAQEAPSHTATKPERREFVFQISRPRAA